MTLRVYVMGSSRDLDRVVPIVGRVKGHPLLHLEHDWTAAVRRAMRAGKTDADLSPYDALQHAQEDMDAVENADIRWLLMPPPAAPSRGAWAEFGASLQCQGNTIVSGPGWRECIFTRLAHKTFSADEVAWEWLVTTARLEGAT